MSRDPLAKVIGPTLNREEFEEMASMAWHQLGVLFAKPETIAEASIRADVEQLGTKLYGERGKRR